MDNDVINYHDAVHMFITTSRLHHVTAENLISKTGCHHSQHRMLLCLKKRNEAVSSQKDLAKKMEISPAAIAVTLKKMENNGLIDRAPGNEDGRINNIAITSKGEAILTEGKLALDSLDKAMFDGIDPDDLAVFMSCLTKMQKNLRALCPNSCASGKDD